MESSCYHSHSWEWEYQLTKRWIPLQSRNMNIVNTDLPHNRNMEDPKGIKT